MPIVPFLPPATVQSARPGHFDYVTVDAKRRRVYAAHGGNDSLLIVNADTGKVLGQVKVGPMAGVAVNERTGNVYTGDGDAEAVSEVNPVTMKEVHRVSVSGHVDAIAYDPQLHRIYADEDDGTKIFVIDTRSFKQIGTIPLPGHKPEYLVIDPKTHVLYQNIASNSEIAVIDPHSMKVVRLIKTPEITGNHPLQIDTQNDTLVLGGGGHLSVYSLQGKRIATTALPRVDQCSIENLHHRFACAGEGGITVYYLPARGVPAKLATEAVKGRTHNVGVDDKTGRLWVTSTDGNQDYVQAFDVVE